MSNAIHSSSIWFSWWGEADIVVKGVFFTLITLSLLSWVVIIYKSLLFQRLGKQEQLCEQFLRQPQGRLPAADSVLTAQLLLQTDDDHRSDTWQDLFIRKRLELENHLTILATIGNSAPFIGLLGTVWGIMLALQKMDASQGVSLDMISGPVGEALAATAMGLFAAIPAVIGYNLLVRRLRKLHTLIEINAKALLRKPHLLSNHPAPLTAAKLETQTA